MFPPFLTAARILPMPLTHKERAERRELIAKAVAAGESKYEVARRLRVCERTVKYACSVHGVQIRGTRRVFPRTGPLRVLAAVLRADPGESIPAIAVKLGVSKQYVFQVVQECWRLGIKTGRWLPPQPKPAPLTPGTAQTMMRSANG